MLQNKNFTRLLSLALAIFLWVYVVTVENPPTKIKFSSIPVKLVNVESLNQRGLAINSDEEFRIDIVIEGKRSDVLKVSTSDIIATADVFGYGIGENYIPVTVTVPDTVRVAEQKPNKLIINIEELVSVYKPISVVYSGSSKENQEPTIVSMTPQEVEVKGAKSRVAKVSSVYATIDVTKLTHTPQLFTSDLYTIDAKGQPVSNIRLSSDTVDIESAIYETKEVPLEVEIVGDVDGKYKVTEMRVPEVVKLKGLKENLDKINKITAKPIDISTVTATTDIPISLNLPHGIMLAQKSENLAVSISIKGIGVKEFEIPSSSITSEGLDQGLSLVINTQSVIVRVSGNEADVERLTAEDLMLSVDLTGLQPGIHTLPLKLEEKTGTMEMTATPKEIHITINEAV
ncbi:MAG: YbbR-like domain-containing protein [Aminipila sp.]